jgi:hypothetical protein
MCNIGEILAAEANVTFRLATTPFPLSTSAICSSSPQLCGYRSPFSGVFWILPYTFNTNFKLLAVMSRCDSRHKSYIESGMILLKFNFGVPSFEKPGFFFQRHSSHEHHRNERYAARASFAACLCTPVSRLAFFSFLFGRSCFKLDMVEVLFVDVVSEVRFSDSCGWEASLEGWDDMSEVL